MEFPLRRRILTASLSMSLLSACSGQPAGLPYSQMPRFQLAQLDGPAGVVKPTEQHPPAARGTETLIVSISQFLSKFMRVLAVPAAVNKVVITVTAADGTVFTEILDLAALTSGQTSVTFNGLVPGDATIVIEAFNAANQVIGTSRDIATVIPGVIAERDMSLSVGGAPASGGSGGSGGGASVPVMTPSVAPTPGILTTEVGLIGGPSLPSLTPWPVVPDAGRRIAFDTDADRYWALVYSETGYHLREVNSQGGTVKSLPVENHGLAYNRLAIDMTHHFWIADQNTNVYRLSPTGSVLWMREFHDPAGPDFILMTADMVVDPDNHVWLPYQNRLLRVSPDGDIDKTIRLDEPLNVLVRDPHSGVLWGIGERGNWVLKVTPDGTATRFPVASSGSSNGALIGVDATGHVWLPRREAEEVLKLAPDGTIAARFAIPGVQGVYGDASGTPWILDEAGVYRLGPDGRPGDGYAIPNISYAAISSRTGRVWALRGASLFPLTP